MTDTSSLIRRSPTWEVVHDVFYQWANNHEDSFKPGLNPVPTMKVLIFLALLDAHKSCTYLEIKEILKTKGVINGTVPDNTLRTSILSLGKILDKTNHPLQLGSSRGTFNLVTRSHALTFRPPSIKQQKQEPVLLLLTPSAINTEEIAYELVEKARLPCQALYFLEWSARWWEIFSHHESQVRVQYEVDAWEKLGIKDRILDNQHEIIGFVGLAPGEGLAEIALLKKILLENPQKKIHYLAVDSSQRLLRAHINLLKEMLANEIARDRIICAGVIANIFCNFGDTLNRVKEELVNHTIINQKHDFIPPSSSLVITYLGNCLGNHYQDQETEIFSIIYGAFQNRPLAFLVGVSVMRTTADEYKRSWDDFLLQTPKHLLETNQLLISSRKTNSKALPEFSLKSTGNHNRCPLVIPEPYVVRHGIEGQVYRFYYRLEYELGLSPTLNKALRPLPQGALILLYNIVKYDMNTLVRGIASSCSYKINYAKNNHQMVNTANGEREYAVFSAFLEK